MALRLVTLGVVGLHLALLLASVPDYRVSVDSAYHTALGRQYALHGVYFWDDVHYGPGGRPNLQGPAVHAAIGVLGRLLGGEGDDFVLANALLGVACWLAAVATALFFAHRFAGERAALLSAAVLTGSAFASGSFYVNLPSGWMFVATPWAIHFFLARRLWLAALVGALACYMHLGGFATAPLGLLAAALLAGRWRDLAATGIGIGLLTAPYWAHFLFSLDWYVGEKGNTTWLFDPLVDLFWIVGVLAALRAPRRNAFLLAWAAAPAVWIFQDTSRFVLQSSMAGAALGGIAVGRWLDGVRHASRRAIATAAIVLLATLFPLGLPGLGAEVTWLMAHYPRVLDWNEMRMDARVIRERGLTDRLVSGYTSYVVSALSIWTDIQGEKGHWVEVQPAVDPADEISVAEKIHLVAIPPDDEELGAWQERGWLTVHGGGRWTSVIGFDRRPSVAEASAARSATIAREAAWIAGHCEHNTLGDPGKVFGDPAEIPRRFAARGECRSRVARLQIADLLASYALETDEPGRARRLRIEARSLGSMQALVGDPEALDYRTQEAHARMRDDMRLLSAAARSGGDVDDALAATLASYLGAKRGNLLESGPSRPIGSPAPVVRSTAIDSTSR